MSYQPTPILSPEPKGILLAAETNIFIWPIVTHLKWLFLKHPPIILDLNWKSNFKTTARQIHLDFMLNWHRQPSSTDKKATCQKCICKSEGWNSGCTFPRPQHGAGGWIPRSSHLKSLSKRGRQKGTGRFDCETKNSNPSFPIINQHERKPKSLLSDPQFFHL